MKAMAVGDEENAIFAEPTTWTGSIGVVIPHYDVSGLLANWKIEDDSIAEPGDPDNPLGRAQLLLDCLADAQVADAIMDCDGESESPLSLAMAPRRGLVDALGCRGATDGGGASSLDSQLAQALDGWPTDAELSALTQGRHSILDVLRIQSRLRAQSTTVASHRILEAELGREVGDRAQQIPLSRLSQARVGPFHTNTAEGFEVARKLLMAQKKDMRQIVMITDGKPSAITLPNGEVYMNSAGLDPHVLRETFRDADTVRVHPIITHGGSSVNSVPADVRLVFTNVRSAPFFQSSIRRPVVANGT